LLANAGGEYNAPIFTIYSTMDLREPLDELAIAPTRFTRHLLFPDPAEIRIYDDTLRDGEQMPGVAFSPNQKLEIAILLSQIGVHVIDPAFPAVSESDRKALQLIVRAQRQGKIRQEIELLAMCRALKEDIDAVVDTVTAIGAHPDDVSVLVLSTLSDLHLKYKLGKTLLRQAGQPEEQWLDRPVDFYREQNLILITGAIKYAREQGITRVEFAAEDASRSDVSYGEVWAKACVAAGGTRMCFSDTCGVFTPEAVDHYIPRLVSVLGSVPLTAHFHNDFGLGAINTVRAISHGARYAGVTANGIGERAGNTPLHEVVMILKMLYGVELPGFRYDLLTELRRKVELYSGIALHPHEPIVGEGVFKHESGIHTAGIAIHPAIYQFISEGSVGGEQCFVFGKHSGAAAVETVLGKHSRTLAEHGVQISPQLVKRVLDDVKHLRELSLPEKGYPDAISRHYQHYYALGLSEERIVELAVQAASRGIDS
jgi:isopropylmalate/homocitrate/citramalate synthase